MICHCSCCIVHVVATEVSEVTRDAYWPVSVRWVKNLQQNPNHLRRHRGGGNGDGDDANGEDNHDRARHLLDMIHVHVHNLEGWSTLHLFEIASHPHHSDYTQVG